MATLTLFESMNLVELVIYGFIALNMFLSGTYLVRRGFEKRAAARAV